ncbi:sporulation peptidase YabG [Paenibacillus lactis]|uniref:Sporulation peptidase YabG n=2 Tax=Paenibacillus lactis TaxID=228574 RepID=G4HP04_9BACL|nr:sporulation peptidase YabG [Paenibacillus lactis]EHB49636.1 sporulation peptidase YabG [Paenibacillus lactis 154]MBP1896538.1 spore coat assembly protein [Paenibacillus lactis]GIO94525.1 sporulation peptidase YabG [Paenibacillus lactis]HAF99048.1 sporulation peptidase YabG [Paenibacillus lactis]
MNLGDLVVRKSYGGDVTFRVEGLRHNLIVIKGTEFRLLADAPADDLIQVPHPAVSERTKQAQIKANETLESLQKRRQEESERQLKSLRNNGGPQAAKGYFDVPGKVLHLDGDPQYLKKSMALYNQLRVPAEGHYVNESAMADTLYRLLPRVRPDIVVITGHDGVLKRRQPYDLYSLDSYKNSHNFVSAIQVARQYERNLDTLAIVAGACQSHFEALLQAGANFASSPGRILIHALDPVYVAAKTAYTSVRETVNLNDVIHHTISGSQGVGGIETRGSYRIGLPSLQDLSTLKVTPSVS